MDTKHASHKMQRIKVDPCCWKTTWWECLSLATIFSYPLDHPASKIWPKLSFGCSFIQKQVKKHILEYSLALTLMSIRSLYDWILSHCWFIIKFWPLLAKEQWNTFYYSVLKTSPGHHLAFNKESILNHIKPPLAE